MKEEKEFNVLVAGVGGQGNILTAHIIAEAALLEGIRVRVGETFGMSQKGGAVMSHVRMGSEIFSPLVPLRRGNLVIGLEPIETLRVAANYSAPKSSIFFNTIPNLPIDVKIRKCRYPTLDAVISLLKQIGKEVLGIDGLSLAKRVGDSRTLNMVMLGFSVSSKIFPITPDKFTRAIEEVVAPKWVDTNIEAFKLGAKTFPK